MPSDRIQKLYSEASWFEHQPEHVKAAINHLEARLGSVSAARDDAQRALLDMAKSMSLEQEARQCWVAVAAAVAGAFNCDSSKSAVTWADNVTKQFRERFIDQPKEKQA